LVLVYSRFENFAKVITGGVDFNLTYVLPTAQIPGMEDAGRFKFTGSATFLASYDQFLPGSEGDIQKTGQTGTFQGGTGAALPRWKMNPSLTWSNGGLEVTWNTRIVWHVVEGCNDGIDPSLVDLGLCSIPDHVAADGSPDPQNKMRTVAKHDLQVGYRWAPSKFGITLGAQNIFNTDPPVSYSAFANSYDPSDYWIPGTLVYVRLQKDF
jgi:iron complex outermembrane receptor protein